MPGLPGRDGVDGMNGTIGPPGSDVSSAHMQVNSAHNCWVESVYVGLQRFGEKQTSPEPLVDVST